MKILFIGDAVGEAGIKLLDRHLRELKKKYGADAVIVNAENASRGNGTAKSEAERLFASGADILTGGNHSFDRGDKTVFEMPYVIRPINLNTDDGVGCTVYDAVRYKFAVVNACGRVNMPDCRDPFEAVKTKVTELKKECPTVIVDFHAEATSEKKAMGIWLSGLATAVIGTHIHCQTNDEEILGNYTAYISDVGYTGSKNSILGCRYEEIIDRFANGGSEKLRQDDRPPYMINGVLIEADGNGKAVSIIKIKEIYDK